MLMVGWSDRQATQHDQHPSQVSQKQGGHSQLTSQNQKEDQKPSKQMTKSQRVATQHFFQKYITLFRASSPEPHSEIIYSYLTYSSNYFDSWLSDTTQNGAQSHEITAWKQNETLGAHPPRSSKNGFQNHVAWNLCHSL